MSRDAIELESGAGRRRASLWIKVLFGVSLTALPTGCVTGTTGATKFSWFAKNDQEMDSGTAAMEPSPECPNCSLPAGVVADSGQVPAQMPGPTGVPLDGVSFPNAHGVMQPPPAMENIPAVPPPAQVPPESGHSVAANSLSKGPGSAPATTIQGIPQTTGPLANSATGHMPVQQPAQPLSGPLPTNPPSNQQVYSQAGQFVPQSPVASQVVAAHPAPSYPAGQKTWEQLQLERQRTQQFYSAHSQPMPQQQIVTQQMVPWHAPGCPPGMQPTPGFDAPWHAMPPQQMALDGSSACPPATISSELQSCKDQVDRLSSRIEDLERSNEKALETALILAEQQRRTAEENKMLRETQKAESQRQLEYFDALLNAIGEEEADQFSGQPDPQASIRRSRSARSVSPTTTRPAGPTTARPVSRTRNQPVTLPSVDE